MQARITTGAELWYRIPETRGQSGVCGSVSPFGTGTVGHSAATQILSQFATQISSPTDPAPNPGRANKTHRGGCHKPGPGGIAPTTSCTRRHSRQPQEDLGDVLDTNPRRSFRNPTHDRCRFFTEARRLRP